MKIIVTGASGFIGRNLASYLLKNGLDVYAIFKSHRISLKNSRQCDLKNYYLAKKIISEVNPDVIVHCSATSSVEQCEREKIASWENNVLVTLNLLKSADSETHFVFLSSSEVFDGRLGLYREDSPRNPVNWYGHTKAAAEDLVSNIAPNNTIVRLSFQYGFDYAEKNFVHCAMVKLLRDELVYSTDELISSPTYINTTIQGIHEIIKNRILGTYNIADMEPLSKYNLISRLSQVIRKPHLVRREKTDNLFLAKRPKNSSLNVSKISSLKNFQPLSIENALIEFQLDFKRQNYATNIQ